MLARSRACGAALRPARAPWRNRDSHRFPRPRWGATLQTV